MDGLQAEFGDRIEFIALDIDDSSTLPMREQYDIVGRTRYVLVNPDGSVAKRWFGPLNGASMRAEIQAYLDSL